MKEFELIASVPALASINLNYEDLKEQLTEFTAGYKNIIITEDQKQEAKADVANLRKLKSELDRKRIDIKKEYMQPCDEFEKKVKSLLAIIDEPITIIDGKLKEFEEKRKEEKRAVVKGIFAEEMEGYNVTLEDIYKPAWENVTYTESAIRADIQEVKLTIDREINILLSMKSEVGDKAIKKYYESGRNLAIAIDYINQYEENKREVLRQQEEEAKRKAEEDAKKAQNDAEETNRKRIIISESSIADLRQIDASNAIGFTNDIIGFSNSGGKEINFALEIDESEVDDVLKLLSDCGYKARRI